MLDGYIAKFEISGFTKVEDEGLARAALVKLGVSHFSMSEPMTTISFTTFVPQMDFTSWGNWQVTLDNMLAPLGWLFETPLSYKVDFQSIPTAPQLVSNSFGGNSVELSVSSNDIQESKEGSIMTRCEPLEELLSSVSDQDRALALLILGLGLDSIKEKAMRFKEASDFVV